MTDHDLVVNQCNLLSIKEQKNCVKVDIKKQMNIELFLMRVTSTNSIMTLY